jgi:hypothetical protein
MDTEEAVYKIVSTIHIMLGMFMKVSEGWDVATWEIRVYIGWHIFKYIKCQV